MNFLCVFKKQQIHAQQIPGAPPQPMPGLGAMTGGGPMGPFGGPMGGLPQHVTAAGGGPPGLLKAPQDLQRGDLKGGPLGSDDRLVSEVMIMMMMMM